MSETSKRLKEYVQSKGMTVAEFEKRCGLSNGYTNNIRKGIGKDKLSQIKEIFPDFNENWIFHGIKEEGKEQEDNMRLEQFLNILSMQQQLTAKSQEQIDRLLSIMEADRNIERKKETA